MDIKKIIQLVLIALIVGIGVQLIMGHFFGKPQAAAPVTVRSEAHGVAIETVVAAPAQVVRLGSSAAADGKKFLLAMWIDNVSAGIKRVELNSRQYRESVNSSKPLVLLIHRKGSPLPYSTSEVTVNGARYDVGALAWSFVPRVKSGATKAVLELQLENSRNQPLVLLKKIFQIQPRNYQVTITQEIKNLTNQPETVRVAMLGPTNLPQLDREADLRMFWCTGYRAASKYLDTSGFPHPGVQPLLEGGVQPIPLGNFIGQNRLLWIASSNRFFTSIMRPMPYGPVQYLPLDNGRQIPAVNYLKSATLERVDPEAQQANPRGVLAVRVQSRNLLLPPHATTAMPLAVYMGPLKRSILMGSAKANVKTPAYQYNLYGYLAVIDFGRGSYCSFCTFSWLSLIILKILDLIYHYIVGNYGVAIIILVLLVRLLLHPLTRWGQINMTTMQRKMAKVQPEMERIRTKYAKDKQRQQQEIMALYKERNINPAASILGCLPMLLQMPIWIALYSGLAVDIDLRQAGFIPGWITNLANPDTLATFHTPFSVWFLGYTYHGQDFIAVNLLPILLGVVFFFQMRFQMKLAPPPTDPQQAQTQKISQFMAIVFPLFLYNAPSGLNLYIVASTLGGLVDTTVVRRHLKKLEARQAAAEMALQKK
ncbi:MAG: YidC/Oxa1 family insertase periplasmic-domain containing protein [Phycisphaerae bacterium]